MYKLISGRVDCYSSELLNSSARMFWESEGSIRKYLRGCCSIRKVVLPGGADTLKAIGDGRLTIVHRWQLVLIRGVNILEAIVDGRLIIAHRWQPVR